MKKSVIIVGGGSGVRMGGDLPKQFLSLAGKPVIYHNLLKFREYDPSIRVIMVLPEESMDLWQNICQKEHLLLDYEIVNGGGERFYSVKNALELIGTNELVAIHDAVRPLVSTALINRCFTEAICNGTAIPVIQVNDTIRKIEEGGSTVVSRSAIRLVQTPQVFQSDLIKEAYSTDYHVSFTDDAVVVERSGVKLNLVEGERWNLKITHPPDMIVAKALMNR